MNRSNIIQRIKSKTTTIDLFNYDSLTAPPLLSLLTYEDIEYFRQLATSIKYSAKIDYKYSEIDKVMRMRGFKKLGGGTNRVVYRHLNIDTIVVKIAIDNIGIKDNPREYQNQFYLKPYVTKVFEVSPCGTVGLFERCEQINSREEFKSIASEVYDLLSNWIIGKYIMEDIGSKYFMNYCVRPGFGPVLCDFPYLYELDGNKLYCRIPDEHGFLCDGIIDYDKGFNHLYCSKCGAKYKAIELKKAIENKLIINKKKEIEKMLIELKRGNKIIKSNDTTKESRKFESVIEKKYRNVNTKMDCALVNKNTGEEVKKILSSNIGEIIDEVIDDDVKELLEEDNDIVEVESDNFELSDELESDIRDSVNNFINDLKDDIIKTNNILVDITLSLREREGGNVFIEDYFDIDGDNKEFNNIVTNLVTDIKNEVSEDEWDNVSKILDSYFKVFKNISSDELSDDDSIDGSYDNGEPDNTEIEEEIEVIEEQEEENKTFYVDTDNASEDTIPVGAVQVQQHNNDPIIIGSHKYKNYKKN